MTEKRAANQGKKAPSIEWIRELDRVFTDNYPPQQKPIFKQRLGAKATENTTATTRISGPSPTWVSGNGRS